MHDKWSTYQESCNALDRIDYVNEKRRSSLLNVTSPTEDEMRCDQTASNIFSESFRSADVAEHTKIHNNSSGLSPPTPSRQHHQYCARAEWKIFSHVSLPKALRCYPRPETDTHIISRLVHCFVLLNLCS